MFEVFALFAGLVFGAIMLFLGCGVVLLVAPFFKTALLNDPSNPEKFALFTAPEPGRSSIIMRGGSLQHVVHGRNTTDPKIKEKLFGNVLLDAYDYYVKYFGLRFIGVPGMHRVLTYDLPRYRKIEENGKLTYAAVKKDDPGRRSDHFRTQITPWYNEFTGVDIEGVPFDVKCATNFSITQDLIPRAAFEVESWNVLLDQALNAVVRGTLRELVSLDDAIGGISQDIWKEREGNPSQEEKVWQQKILERLHGYTLKNGSTLAQMGINIQSFEILDFAPEELSKEELEKLRAPALARRLAQARTMEGKAEAEYQDQVLAVLAKHPELAKANVAAEAFVKAAKAGTLDALAAGLLKKLTS